MKMSVKPLSNTSQLTAGRHPAFLIHVDEEPTPTDWQMAGKSPTMWRWYVAVWENPDRIGQVEPEIQTAITSATFTPKGKFPASTAYLWTQEMLQRQIPVGEEIDWDSLVPYPCTCKIERIDGKDYVRVKDLEAWPDGQQYLPSLRALLLQHKAAAQRASASARATRAQNGTVPPASPAPPADPSLRTWGSPASPPVGWGSAPPPAPAASLQRQPEDEPDDDIPF
jgi:hypothetical protein